MQATVRARTAASGETAITIRGLEFTYGEGARAVRTLEGVDLDIARGEFVSLLGPSGCGKSTLLYLIGGFVPFRTGEISVGGRPVKGPGPDRGIVFQQFALFPWKTVLQNVLYGMEKQRVPRAERLARAADLIRTVRLDGFENHFPAQLSGGMRQRAAIARTLAVDPDILLMDEPFGALDAQTRSVMQEQLKGIWQSTGKTVIFVTHDVREAVYLSERVVLLTKRPGRIKEVVDTRFPKTGEFTT
ncbi:MAG: ABC transporter ATP-binding protein, partial [Alphaproteobacteria bacterium]